MLRFIYTISPNGIPSPYGSLCWPFLPPGRTVRALITLSAITRHVSPFRHLPGCAEGELPYSPLPLVFPCWWFLSADQPPAARKRIFVPSCCLLSGFNVDDCHLFSFGNLPFCQRGKVCRCRCHECAYQFGMYFRVSFPGVAVDNFYRPPQPVFCQIKGVRLCFLCVSLSQPLPHSNKIKFLHFNPSPVHLFPFLLLIHCVKG